jgi:quercetin dioxygenase-like cupin family protein
MIVKNLNQVPFADTRGYNGVKKQVVIGPQDGSDEIVIRYFSLQPGGNSPFHTHNFPHLVKIEKGSGFVKDANGVEHPLTVGDFVYVKDDEVHQFVNTGDDVFDFICVVPRRGEA